MITSPDDSRKHLLDLAADDFSQVIESAGEKRFRQRQIRRWIFENRAESFDDMLDLPKTLRETLSERLSIWTSRVVKHSRSPDGTEKLLVEWPDGGQVECVLLRDGQRRSICVSSQVGCAMGCVFCASGLDGVERNLTAGEILEQMLRLQRLLPAEERISHIVMMGMGEPLANLTNVLACLQQASAADGLGISPRRITISTVGIPQAIQKLSELKTSYNLAVSLHAPNDELRTRLVPVNSTIGIRKVLDAADQYFESSGRRLTFEYVLLAGINDQREHAQQLAHLLRKRSVLLNVIPYNPVSGLPYRTPSSRSIANFRQVLTAAGVTIQFRQKKGDEINAACGQLRRVSQKRVTQIGPAEASPE
ncbi:MAG: 23S rRNA (adenine(2503)-C(2))-methyltransferase RlmN [Planctomycetota bacterium]|nr:23S rRNA (adenine(2503)-C(2))-methyltransferase RlmN [Planctomycetota bacterium]